MRIDNLFLMLYNVKEQIRKEEKMKLIKGKSHKLQRMVGAFLAIVIIACSLYIPNMMITKASSEIDTYDLNGDGIVNVKDIIRLKKAIHGNIYSEVLDINNDSVISDADMNLILSNLGHKCPEKEVIMSLTSGNNDGVRYSVSLSFENNFSGSVEYKFISGGKEYVESRDANVIANSDLSSSFTDLSFLSGNFTVEITAKNARYSDTKTVSYINGLPQLSADSYNLVVDAMTTQEKVSLLVLCSASGGMAGQTYAISKFGIPSAQFADGPAGLRISSNTIGYPSGSALAATWDTEIVKKIASLIGDDCKQFGVDVLLAPGMNIQKNVLCGRNFEYYSEDPYLSGLMAASYTLGVQSTGVGVSLKHLASNNQETGRYTHSSEVTERAFREIYLRGFGYAVSLGDPYSIMTSYNLINGRPASETGSMMSVMRNDFGFNGFVMTDWGVLGDRTQKINAGNDMYCGTNDTALEISIITNGINSGQISMKQINDCCKNILRSLSKTTAMDRSTPDNTISDKAEKRQIIRQAGTEGIVLLKNNSSTLPFKSNAKISVFGNASYHTEHCGYGSGYVNVDGVTSINDALKAGGASINSTVKSLYSGCLRHTSQPPESANPENDTLEISISQNNARSAAERSDYAIFTISRVTSETYDHENRAGDFSLNAVERQNLQNISSAFHAKNKKVIVVINTGNPIEVASWEGLADAIVYSGLCGESVGYAVADILTGNATPSGKLTCSWPLSFSDTPYSEFFPGDYTTVAYTDDIYVGYRYFSTFGVDTMYEFGYGLSYTQFEYSDFSLTPDGNDFILSVTVKNTGSGSGREVVQFYTTKPDGKNEHPALELVGFGKTAVLNAGESETVTCRVTYNELRTYVTSDEEWIVEQGEYKFHVGASSKSIHDTKSVSINESVTVQKSENMFTSTDNIAVITKSVPSISFAADKNIAIGKSATASGVEGEYYPSNAFDGNLKTRWSPLGTTDKYFSITSDLGNNTYVSYINILWEANSQGLFNVLISSNGEEWNDLGYFDHSQLNTVKIGTKARYIKIQASANGYFSIYEIGVYQ